jgi:DNA-binding NarL/FixJ family response regulator
LSAPRGGGRSIRLLLVDGKPSVRRGLKMRLALEKDLEVVGEAGNCEEAVPLARALRPDVILMDLEMPGSGGIAVTESLRAAASWSAVVIFSLRDDVATREKARAAGAAAFVAKHRTEEMLLAAIREAAAKYGDREHHCRGVAKREEHAGDRHDRRDP